ncbi:MAG: photosynthetic reaction center cytochrome PufC [Geminicoccaceae bacterium]
MNTNNRVQLVWAAAITGVIAAGLVSTFEMWPMETIQRGYRGLGMEAVYNPRTVAQLQVANQLPAVIDPVEPGGTKSSEVYQNVPVLGNLDADEFTRLMQAITEWVSPVQGCAYCHKDGEDLSSDSLYTKVVARRMLQMVQHINADWKSHVVATGVTCYTCHRGNPVPQNIWFTNPGPRTAPGSLGNRAGQNYPSVTAAYSSLPFDPLTPFLLENNNIRVEGNTALPTTNRKSIKQAEWTYSLMMHISKGLGVNCTYCHNTRAFPQWGQSSPPRVTAWHGIQMTRSLNVDYLVPLGSQLPANRLGPLGDPPKVDCTTCHAGVYKPLFGASMLKDYPELAGPLQ